MRVLVIALIITAINGSVTAQMIAIRQAREGQQVNLLVKNLLPCPITLSISLDSISTEPRFLPKYGERIITTMPARLLQSLPDTVRVEYNFTFGNPDGTHDSRYRYSLPFPKGTSYELIQGINGEFSHNTPYARYAYDFKMPKGSIITAARGGVVGYVEESFSAGGPDERYISKANHVVVCHDDGSIGIYVHLKQDGALVNIGDPVYVGKVIGLSGNSGYSSVPHLHFAVLIGSNSVPIRFVSHGHLRAGRVYDH